MPSRAAKLQEMSQSLPGPENVSREVLANGLVVLARANFSSPSVSISGYLRTGSLLDPVEKLGLADFTASALMRGTQRRTFDSFYNELESVGASLGFDAGISSTGFHGHALAEDLRLLLQLLAEALREPAFPAKEIEKLRHQLLTGLAIRAQDTADMADMTFDRVLFRGHPYSRPEDGTLDTIKAIRRSDLLGFHRRTYGPAGMVLAIVGAVEPERVIAMVHRALGTWQVRGQQQVPDVSEPRPLKRTTERHHRILGKSQADIMIGTRGPRRTSAEHLAASLANSILGQFGMMGRIGKSVREVSGLAYYAYSQLSAGVGPGTWTVSAGVNPANLTKARDLIIAELSRFVETGPTRLELQDSQSNFVGRLPLSLESNAGVCGALLNTERYGLGLDYYQRYASLVRNTRRADVIACVRRWIDPDRLVVASAGP